MRICHDMEIKGLIQKEESIKWLQLLISNEMKTITESSIQHLRMLSVDVTVQTFYKQVFDIQVCNN